MLWFLSLAAGTYILIMVCPKLYMGYTTVNLRNKSAAERGKRIPPDDISTAKLRKNGLVIFLIVSLSLIAYGATGYFLGRAAKKQEESYRMPALPTINVPSDPGASYSILAREKSGAQRVIMTKRTGSSGVTYSQRAYNCPNNTVMYLGTGSTFAELESSRPDPQMAAISPGSIAYYIGLEACK
ncbi:hypothetical protein V2J73_02915 [Pseudomonas alliivorans]|nr:hypothetical protein [Pseudomonas alliivorans]